MHRREEWRWKWWIANVEGVDFSRWMALALGRNNTELAEKCLIEKEN
ncbi:hypothetical protein HCH_03940 [Hahella chejuensis KCTC 2396]|uniref:Uncharacterized protein n=1 Tax=Hahella chejuensis (strain KCTC 2396) TaxID=349521 RepID=Q2SFB4_HAHCH|nr:hypothetical protein HCH_03940 [Hahella chejuensis KCTC 2396]